MVTVQDGTGVYEGAWTVYDCNLRVGFGYTRQEAEHIARQVRARNAAQTRRQKAKKQEVST